MASSTDPIGTRAPAPFRMVSGFDLLDDWSLSASQAERNVVHRVLFSIAGRSVFTHYDVIDDATRTMEFFVATKCDIAIKVRVYSLDAFGVTYIGPILTAPGLDQAPPELDVRCDDQAHPAPTD